MHSARFPTDEPARLRTLRGLDVLDSMPEPFSDAIAAAAAAIAGVPISAVSLVDTERQWFKASCGLAERSTSRDVSFCAHTILGCEPLLVEDSLADERFVDNPLVVGAPYIRAYAGFPLIVAGHAVGALCVIDDRPRGFPATIVQQLQQLAAGTAAWLADRQRLSALLERTREQLRQVTFNDSATGLPTRMMLQDRLLQAASRADRTRQTLAVLYVRLDHGHAHAAQSLMTDLDARAVREVADRLVRIGRTVDTVARIGESEFVLLAEGHGNVEATRRLAQAVHDGFEPPVRSGPLDVYLGATVGAALYPPDGPADRLVAFAAMAGARQEHGVGCGFFSKHIGEMEGRRADLLAGLRQVDMRREFTLHYQPKVDSHNMRVTGVEALLRWTHPRLGPVSPADFIPLAEETGFIEDIGRWVLVEALRQMREWSERGLRLRVAINLSARQLRNPTLASDIEALIDAENLDPALVTLEVTETVAMDDTTAASTTFTRLKAVGVRISIDDFGTGYSSLAYLRRLPVHQLKIDRSFVADLDHGEDAEAIVKAIIQLAHALRLEVVAEGVETESQRRTLTEFGCDKLQGFLFARPMNADALTQWMQATAT